MYTTVVTIASNGNRYFGRTVETLEQAEIEAEIMNEILLASNVKSHEAVCTVEEK